MNCKSAAAAGAALLAAWASPCAANDGSDGIVSLPILGHSHVVERRRRELKDSGVSISDWDRVPAPHQSNLRHPSDEPLGDHGRQLAPYRHDQQLGALYQGYGTHYLDLWVGYPAQRQTAVVDTGSSVTAFPCSECKNCGRHADPPFDESKSNSFRATRCPKTKEDSGCVFGMCDQNGMCMIEHNFGAPGSADASSWTAFEASDVAYVGGPHDKAVDGRNVPIKPSEDVMNPVHAPEFSFPLTFGCQTTVTGYFERQLASGVVGLDRRARSFWGQMRASSVIKRAQFSLCFVKQPIASASGSTAGAFTMGGVDQRLHKTPMVYAKSLGEGSTASFKVRLRKMYLREGNAQSVMYDAKSKYHQLDVPEEKLNGEEMYNFDSGTTDTYLIKSLSDEFRAKWKEVTGEEYTNDPIMVKQDSDLLKFPSLILQMVPDNGGRGDEVDTGDPREVPGLAGNLDIEMPNDVLLAIPPRHYMQRNARDGTYAPRIYLDRDDALGNVLGANAMMGHDVTFDLDGARIGFSESDCDYAGLVGSGQEGISSGGSGSASYAGALEEEGSGDYKICSSMKCRGFFGLTVAVLFCGFFMFARRYVTKRDDGARSRRTPEYEMKSTRNLAYSDETGSFSRGYSDEHLPGGERGGYHDSIPPPSYSDHRSSRHLERSSGSRRDRSGSRESDRHSRNGERRSSRDRGERRSSSRDSADGHRSTQSVRSHRTHDSGGSGGSGGSRETRQSTRSHRSTRSKESQRSGGSRESHRSRESNRSRESHHSNRSRESRRSSSSRQHGSSRERDEYGRQSSSRGSRYQEDYDDIPMPGQIA